MVLTVFLAIRAAQKHASAAECQRSRGQKRGKVFTQAFSRKRALTALPILLRPAGKLTSSAKVRLEANDARCGVVDSRVPRALRKKPTFVPKNAAPGKSRWYNRWPVRPPHNDAYRDAYSLPATGSPSHQGIVCRRFDGCPAARRPDAIRSRHVQPDACRGGGTGAG